MSDASASAAPARGNPWTLFVLVSVYLIAAFLWRFFVPANEYPSRTVTYMTMMLDLLAVVGVTGLRAQVAKAYDDDATKVFGTVLFCLALLAGLGLFCIRLGGHMSWWTGHRLFELLPR